MSFTNEQRKKNILNKRRKRTLEMISRKGKLLAGGNDNTCIAFATHTLNLQRNVCA